MGLGRTFMNGVVKGANFFGMKGLEASGKKAINAMDGGAGFGNSILATGAKRIMDNDKLLNALGKSKNADGSLDHALSSWDVARSAFYNKQGELQKGRVATGIAGAYMGANMIGHGSLGVPFISSASWTR